MKQVPSQSLRSRDANSCGEKLSRFVRLFARRAFVAGALLAIAGIGCEGSSTSDGPGITGVSQSAPDLPEFDPDTGDYDPYYGTGDLNRPRYMHESIFAGGGGLAFVFGGSDERGLSTLDTVEFFDQAAVDQEAVQPESESGAWFDTNFEGDEMILEGGPRIFFTLNQLSNGTVLILGGTPDIDANGRVYETPQTFDPETRTFEALSEAEMLIPRFRHTTTQLLNGDFLVIGGQSNSAVTVINEEVESGQPGRQEQRTVFGSTNTIEVFTVTDNSFSPIFFPNSNREVTLNTPRGRAGHDIRTIAGFDLRLRSADDLLLIAGGFQTLSTVGAPETKLWGAVGRDSADALLVLEFIDPVTFIVTQAGNVALEQGRVDSPHITNLGEFNDLTLDGVQGMGNGVLISGGNNDEICPESDINRDSELLVATFTGIGPAQGLQLTNVDDAQNLPQIQGREGAPEDFFELSSAVGRSQSNPVSLLRSIKSTSPNVPEIASWVFFLGGTDVLETEGQNAQCEFSFGGAIDSGVVFDPNYNLANARDGELSARDLSTDRTSSNPLGIVGTFLTLDGDLPTLDDSLFATTSQFRWASMSSPWRVYPRIMAIPGVDGVINTQDDRLLLAGGGADGEAQGGEPAAPSAEIFLPPGVNNREPSD